MCLGELREGARLEELKRYLEMLTGGEMEDVCGLEVGGRFTGRGAECRRGWGRGSWYRSWSSWGVVLSG